jgi:hypothetical protein
MSDTKTLLDISVAKTPVNKRNRPGPRGGIKRAFGLMSESPAVKIYRAKARKLDRDLEVLAHYKESKSQRATAEAFGISQAVVQKILARYKH